MANTIYYAPTGLTGGSSGKLDYIDVTNINDGDIAHVAVSGLTYMYRMNVYSGASSNSPFVILPVTGTVANKRWIRQQVHIWFGRDYLVTTISSASNIDQVLLSIQVPEDGGYFASSIVMGMGTGTNSTAASHIKKGNSGSNYGTATSIQLTASTSSVASSYLAAAGNAYISCSANDIIYLGARVEADSGTRYVYGDDIIKKSSSLVVVRLI
jgi:hypothetical protein